MYLGIVAGIVALAAAFYYSKKVESYEINIPKVAEITDAIREGAMAFLVAIQNSCMVRSNRWCSSWILHF